MFNAICFAKCFANIIFGTKVTLNKNVSCNKCYKSENNLQFGTKLPVWHQ